jgi:hypothetical protein
MRWLVVLFDDAMVDANAASADLSVTVTGTFKRSLKIWSFKGFSSWEILNRCAMASKSKDESEHFLSSQRCCSNHVE